MSSCFGSSFSLVFHQLSPVKVEVQVVNQQGLPKLILTGLAERIVKEAQERVLAGMRSAGIKLKGCRTVINLTPTNVPKNDAHLELVILAGLLQSYGLLEVAKTDCFIGTVGLRGEVGGVPTVLALTLAAKKLGFLRVFLAQDDLEQAGLISGIQLVPLCNIKQLLSEDYIISQTKVAHYSLPPTNLAYDLTELACNQRIKRVMQLVAAGGHHLLLIGPPGYGKTLIAHCLHTLLPSLNYQQFLEVALISSLANSDYRPSSTPPFQEPSHMCSKSLLLGNANQARYGLVHLAHHGILFLDELHQFSTDCLVGLRYYLDELPTTARQLSRPSFILLAATNPCPCGYYGTQIKACSCSLYHRQRYEQKVSGALLDRFDLVVDVSDSIISDIAQLETDQVLTFTDIQQMNKQVCMAREKQSTRYFEQNWWLNAQLPGSKVVKQFSLSNQCQQLLSKAKHNLKLSNRAICKTIKLAATMADLENENRIKPKFLAEALSYRKR